MNDAIAPPRAHAHPPGRESPRLGDTAGALLADPFVRAALAVWALVGVARVLLGSASPDTLKATNIPLLVVAFSVLVV